MKASDLDKLTSLAILISTTLNLMLTATRMSFEKNTYIQELWRYSNNKWKKFKGSESKIISILNTLMIKNIYHL